MIWKFLLRQKTLSSVLSLSHLVCSVSIWKGLLTSKYEGHWYRCTPAYNYWNYHPPAPLTHNIVHLLSLISLSLSYLFLSHSSYRLCHLDNMNYGVLLVAPEPDCSNLIYTAGLHRCPINSSSNLNSCQQVTSCLNDSSKIL